MYKFAPLVILVCTLWIWQPPKAHSRTDDLRMFGFTQYQIWDFRRLNSKSFDELRNYEIKKLLRYYESIAKESQLTMDVLNEELRFRRRFNTRSYTNRHFRNERRRYNDSIRRRY